MIRQRQLLQLHIEESLYTNLLKPYKTGTLICTDIYLLCSFVYLFVCLREYLNN